MQLFVAPMIYTSFRLVSRSLDRLTQQHESSLTVSSSDIAYLRRSQIERGYISKSLMGLREWIVVMGISTRKDMGAA